MKRPQHQCHYKGSARGRWYQAGVVQTEYLIGTLILTVFMFGNLPGLGYSVADLLLSAFQSYWASTLLLVGLP